ncbi:MAG: Crp/Fnr family transcriptional regulator [Rubrivivax sp.]|jgi:CRP-like cAMP-binding protein
MSVDVNSLPQFTRCLAPGEWLDVQPVWPTAGWRLHSGALSLSVLDVAERETLVGLALPGDVVGLEPNDQSRRTSLAKALVPCVLTPLAMPEDDAGWRQLLARAMGQHWQQAANMSRLRSGTVPERVRRLLLLLAHSAAVPGTAASDQDTAAPGAHPLPRLRDMAALVDTAPETVSRIISGLRRLSLLQERDHRSARYDPHTLAGCELPLALSRGSAQQRALWALPA